MSDYRPIVLASPVMVGVDVRELQEAVNRQFEAFHVERYIAEDGEFGPKTLTASAQVAKMLGIHGPALRKVRRGVVSIATQRLIRAQRRQTKAEQRWFKARELYRDVLRRRYSGEGGARAVKAARQWIGTVESPMGSNSGFWITRWQRYTGYGFPVPWCGCWAAWVVCKLGKARIPERIRLGYAPYITADARAGRNGLTEVRVGQVRAGDIGTLWGGQHIVVIAGRVAGGKVPTIEGNTSSGDGGSQANGGGVYPRVRKVSDFDCFARPNYP